MQRAMVSAVDGLRIFAGGKWLTAIGNKNFNVGDLVWTDGRCVYGNFVEGGESAPIILPENPYVPVLLYGGTHCLYHDGKLKPGIKGDRHTLMASRGGRYVFGEDCLDVSVGKDGKVYKLCGGEYSLHYPDVDDVPYIYQQGEPGVVSEGQMILPVDLSTFASYGEEYARQEIAEKDTPLPSSWGSGPYGEITFLIWNICNLRAGWYESPDSYCFFVTSPVLVEYREGYNWRNEDGSPGWIEADLGYVIDLYCYLYMLQTPSGITVLRGSYNEDPSGMLFDIFGDEYYVEPHHYSDFVKEADIPLPDGYRIHMRRREMDRQEYSKEDYEAYIYTLLSPQGKEICPLEGYDLGYRVSVCKLTGQSWLVGCRGDLYLAKGGKLKYIEYDGYYTQVNSRLRPMKNYQKWMKGEKADGTS